MRVVDVDPAASLTVASLGHSRQPLGWAKIQPFIQRVRKDRDDVPAWTVVKEARVVSSLTVRLMVTRAFWGCSNRVVCEYSEARRVVAGTGKYLFVSWGT